MSDDPGVLTNSTVGMRQSKCGKSENALMNVLLGRRVLRGCSWVKGARVGSESERGRRLLSLFDLQIHPGFVYEQRTPVSNL